MKYYKVLELKTILLKSISMDNREERNAIKKNLAVPVLAQSSIENKQNIVFGKSFPIAISEEIIKSLLPNIDLSIAKRAIANEKDITSCKIHESTKTVYKELNKSNKEKKEISKEERAKQVKQGKDRRIKKSENLINKAKKDLSSDKSILIFDIEAYEHAQDKITEIGLLTVKSGVMSDVEHFIVEENIDLLNGKFVEDNKHNFDFGESKILSQKDSFSLLINKIKESDILMGQNISSDLSYLKKYMKRNNKNSKELDKEIKLIIEKDRIDTASMTFFMSEDGNTMSIKRSLNKLNVENKNLHNAGNDAYYTYQLSKAIISYKDTLNLLSTKKKELEKISNKKASGKRLGNKV